MDYTGLRKMALYGSLAAAIAYTAYTADGSPAGKKTAPHQKAGQLQHYSQRHKYDYQKGRLRVKNISPIKNGQYITLEDALVVCEKPFLTIETGNELVLQLGAPPKKKWKRLDERVAVSRAYKQELLRFDEERQPIFLLYNPLVYGSPGWEDPHTAVLARVKKRIGK